MSISIFVHITYKSKPSSQTFIIDLINPMSILFSLSTANCLSDKVFEEENRLMKMYIKYIMFMVLIKLYSNIN